MSAHPQSVFKGFPRTLETGKNAEKTITVYAKAVSPLMVKIADFLAKYTTIPATFGCVSLGVYNIYETGLVFSNKEYWQLAALAALPVLTYICVRFGLYHLFRNHVIIEFTDNVISIKTLFKTHLFDRKQRHKFTAREHQKATREKRSLKLKETKRKVRWWSLPFKPYYSDAYELAFEHMGQRTVIMSIFKHKKMELILNRLIACDEVIEGYNQNGSGQSLTPEGDWSEHSGELQDAF